MSYAVLNDQSGWRCVDSPTDCAPDEYYSLTQPDLPVLPPTTQQVTDLRSEAYRQESDPLFFKSRRGEATEQEWLDKVDEIKARYPYPVTP